MIILKGFLRRGGGKDGRMRRGGRKDGRMRRGGREGWKDEGGREGRMEG